MSNPQLIGLINLSVSVWNCSKQKVQLFTLDELFTAEPKEHRGLIGEFVVFSGFFLPEVPEKYSGIEWQSLKIYLK